MTIKTTVEENTITLALEGWLDTQAAPELKAAIEGIDPKIESMTLDLEKLEYVASSGLRQFVAAHKKMNGQLTLKNVSPEIMDILNMTGLGKKLNII